MQQGFNYKSVLNKRKLWRACVWIVVKCVYGYLCMAAVSAFINSEKEKNRVTESITWTSQGVSLSCYKWLPRRLACQGWEISHGVACKRLSVNCRGGLRSIFMSLSGIGDATKSENPLGNKKPAGGQFNDPEQDLWIVTPTSETEKQDGKGVIRLNVSVDTGGVLNLVE